MRKLKIISPAVAMVALAAALTASAVVGKPAGYEHLNPLASIADTKSHPQLFQHPAPSGPAVSFKFVARPTLDRMGLSLTTPNGSSTLTQAAAESTAEMNVPGRNVLGSTYARCSITGASVDQDCWVIAVDPTGEVSNPPVGETPQKFTYDLVLVDGASGDEIVELRGN